MNILRFEDIIAWKKSRELTILVYKIFKDNGIIHLKIRYNELAYQL